MLKPITLGIYSFIIMAGGVFGFVKAHSLPSLIMSSVFGILLALCALGMLKKVRYSFVAAQILTSVLFGFFTYRYFLKMQFMPAGMIALLSLATLAVLSTKKQSELKHTN